MRRVPLRCEEAEIAQLVEHDLPKVGVAGSSPVFRSTSFFDTHCGNSSVVEHHLAKVGVAGSKPVFRFTIMPGWRNWQTHRT